jgi:uncharacterized protein Yka (UPF0111/DUF47 family)
MRRRWFLPETPDVVGLLRHQVEVTTAGVDAFVAWAGGDPAAAQGVLDAEDRGDAAKRDLLNALREAFVTPLEPEDAFALSRSIDRMIGFTRDLVGESEVMRCAPDAGIEEMAQLIREALGHIDDAIAQMGSDADAATEAADAALKAERRLQRAYYGGMGPLLEIEDTRERISRRELYRRCARIGEVVVDIAERIQYAIVKQS